MQFNQVQFAAIIETAKSKTNDPKWLRAIDRAATGLLDGSICVTLFADNTALVTTATGQHRVNGRCECKAAQHGHTQCVHRAAKRLTEMIEETAPAPAPVPRPARIVRSIERDVVTGRRVRVTYCDNWPI